MVLLVILTIFFALVILGIFHMMRLLACALVVMAFLAC